MSNRNSIFETPTATTLNLIIINVICLVASKLLVKVDINDIFGLHYVYESDFHWWQLLTYMFMHANLSHLFYNVFALYFFATALEKHWGVKRFLLYYFICGVGAGLVQELVWYFMYGATAYPALTIGASGAVFGVLLAFGWLFPDTKLYLFPIPISIKARVFVLLYAAIELMFGIINLSGDNVAHFAHLGGMIFGLVTILIWKRMDGENTAIVGKDFNIKKIFSKHRKNQKNSEKNNSRYESYHYQEPIRDIDKEKEEIDRILDKIRTSGYDSLTDEEKQKLFNKGHF